MARTFLVPPKIPAGAAAGSFLLADAAGLVSMTQTPMLENGFDLRAKDSVGDPISLLYLGSDDILYFGTDPAPDTNGDIAFMVNAVERARLTPAGLLNIGSGDELFGADPMRLAIYAGTAGTPLTATGPNAKIVRTENISAITQPNPADSAENAALFIHAKGLVTSTPQVTPIYALAEGGGTTGGADVAGICAVGLLTNSGATGYAMGAYIEGRRDFDSGNAYGAEISVNNQTATAGVHSTTSASSTMGIWLPSRGLSGVDNACGIQLGALAGSQWLNGLAFNVGSVLTNSIRDDSSAATSLLINGTHATAAIAIAGGAGKVIIGATAQVLAAPRLEVIAPSGGADPLVLIHGVGSTDPVSIRFSNNVGSVKFFVSGGSGHFLTGTAAGDTGVAIQTSGKQYHIGGAARVVSVAQDDKLGFFAATPIVKPSSTTDLRAALINFGLYTTGGATPLDLNGGKLTAAELKVTTGASTGHVLTSDADGDATWQAPASGPPNFEDVARWWVE